MTLHGITQTILAPSGINSTFWTISKATIDIINGIIQVTLAGYTDNKAISNNYTPLDKRSYSLSGNDFATVAGAGVGNYAVAILTWITVNDADFASGVIS